MKLHLTDLFTFLQDKTIVKRAKEELLEKAKAKKDEFIEFARTVATEHYEEAKEKLVNFFMEHLKLGFPFCLFKKRVKKTIEKNIDELYEAIFKVEKIA